MASPGGRLYIRRMRAPFRKMHGCGNDFVVFDERARPFGFTPACAAALANRRTGIGCDQFITIEPAPAGSGADAFMRIRNPDGSEAGACGNATRCVVHLLAAETGRPAQVIRTISGNLPGEQLADGRVRVDMGPARLHWSEIPLAEPADTLHLGLTAYPQPAGSQAIGGLSAGGLAAACLADPAAASMGNPHATFFVPDLSAVPVEELGPVLEHDRMFPQRANIGFAQVLAPDRLRLRVWERGAGLTLACGSGACAALVNAHRRGLTGPRAAVLVDGGELEIEWRDLETVLMTGPVATAFTGEVELDDYPA